MKACIRMHPFKAATPEGVHPDAPLQLEGVHQDARLQVSNIQNYSKIRWQNTFGLLAVVTTTVSAGCNGRSGAVAVTVEAAACGTAAPS